MDDIKLQNDDVALALLKDFVEDSINTHVATALLSVKGSIKSYIKKKCETEVATINPLKRKVEDLCATVEALQAKIAKYEEMMKELSDEIKKQGTLIDKLQCDQVSDDYIDDDYGEDDGTFQPEQFLDENESVSQSFSDVESNNWGDKGNLKEEKKKPSLSLKKPVEEVAPAHSRSKTSASSAPAPARPKGRGGRKKGVPNSTESKSTLRRKLAVMEAKVRAAKKP